MKGKIRLLLLLIIICLTVTSCWSRRELNELAIVVGIGIDKMGDQYQVTLQVVNPSEVALQAGGTGRAPVIVYKEKGKTIHEAIRRITRIIPRRAFFSHLQILVISEEVAREGIKEALGFFWRDREFRFDFYLVVARKTEAEKVLKILTKLERLPSRKLFTSLEAAEEYWAPARAITLNEVLRKLISGEISPTLTGITIEGDPIEGGEKENTENVTREVGLKYSGMAVFKGDRLIGWLDEMESKGKNYILDRVKSTAAVIHCPGKKEAISLEVIRVDSDVTGRVQNGKPEVNINLQVELNVSETQCGNLDLTQPTTIAQLEKITHDRYRYALRATLHAAQKKYKVDFLGLGAAIHRADPQFWKKIKKNWEEEFVNLPVHLKINVKIRHTGMVSNSFIEKMKNKK